MISKLSVRLCDAALFFLLFQRKNMYVRVDITIPIYTDNRDLIW